MVMPKPPSCAATVSSRSSTLPRSQLSACGGTSPAVARAGTAICALQADSAVPRSIASHWLIVDLGMYPPVKIQASSIAFSGWPAVARSDAGTAAGPGSCLRRAVKWRWAPPVQPDARSDYADDSQDRALIRVKVALTCSGTFGPEV